MNNDIMEQSSLSQVSVEKWLQEPQNQSFTSSFLLNWVKNHPELHKEVLFIVRGEMAHNQHQLCQEHNCKVTPRRGVVFQPKVSDTAFSSASSKENHNEKHEGSNKSKRLIAYLPSACSKESTVSSCDSGVELPKSCDSLVQSKSLDDKVGKCPSKLIKPHTNEQKQAKLQIKIKQLEVKIHLLIMYYHFNYRKV